MPLPPVGGAAALEESVHGAPPAIHLRSVAISVGTVIEDNKTGELER